jgi:Raf kinase inhibitor-like YbhB/YbcL family protein
MSSSHADLSNRCAEPHITLASILLAIHKKQITEAIMSIQVTSEAFAPDATIPSKFTADGQDVSPTLRWGELPAGTQELALIVDDPDAPREQPFVHWVMYKIPADTAGLPEAMPKQTRLKSLAGAVQGKNSFGKIGYGGPAPPAGHGTHHYHFHLYALDKPLQVSGGMDKESLIAAMSGHLLAVGDLVGTYER